MKTPSHLDVDFYEYNDGEPSSELMMRNHNQKTKMMSTSSNHRTSAKNRQNSSTTTSSSTSASSSSASREQLKQAVRERRESLSVMEKEVLDELCQHGSERETELAHQTLLSYCHLPPATAAVVPNMPNQAPLEEQTTTSQGSSRRQALLNSRKQQSSQLWLAHESGLCLTPKNKTTQQQRMTRTTPRHSTNKLLGMVFRAKRVFQCRSSSSSYDPTSFANRILPWQRSLVQRQHHPSPSQRAMSAGGRIENGGGDTSSMFLNATPHSDSAPSTTTTMLVTNHHHHDTNCGRHQSPPPHNDPATAAMIPPPKSRADALLAARNASVNNYYRGEGFEIGYVDLSMSQSHSSSSSSESASTATSDDEGEDELRDSFDAKRELSIGRKHQPREKEPSTKKTTFGRPVLMKRASIFSGEGMEVADYQHTITTAAPDHETWHTTTTTLPRSFSFDPTLSYERIEAQFAKRLRRSESDSDLYRLQKKTGAADVAFLDDLADFAVYDSWLAPTFHPSQNIGFAILGTSAHDSDCHPHVLSPPMMERLHEALPMTRQGENYWLRYSLVRDGASLHSFLDIAKKCSPRAILAIETVDGEVFGCYTSETWHRASESYGHGPSFLWRYRHNRHHKTWSVLDQAILEGELDVYPLVAGSRTEVQLCTTTTFGLGGIRETVTPDRTLSDGTMVGKDEWGFGLRMTGDLLLEGTSSPCYPFQSPSLSRIHADGSRFEIVNMELWTMTPCLDAVEAERLELKHLFLREHLRPL
jgi:TLD